MSTDAMEIDSSESLTMRQKAEALHRLATGQLSSSISKLLGSSRDIPSSKDFHFYNNFDDFKVPIKEIAQKSKIMLDAIGSSSVHLWEKEMGCPEGLDEMYDWLVNMNDEACERLDASIDEFQRLGEKRVENGELQLEGLEGLDNGFQLVPGMEGHDQAMDTAREEDPSLPTVKLVSMGTKNTLAKAKMPFHISSIRRPQDEYKILVNNSNEPFEHVWLQRGDDGLTFIHPQEKFSFKDFVDKDIEHIQPVKPLPIDDTPFKIVEDVKALKLLAAKLHVASEFAVDLEHNQYRSFQGLTCLMQISTRDEDFVVDTLKLRIHIGPYLREVFKDPTKRKVFHGGNNDILWLQRDFGIYVCNMFDTGQASRVLKLDKLSLQYHLYHLCGVTANKEYQNADWRLRPLPKEMIKYAREDTHYLLYIYDLLRIRLHSTPSESENDLLAEVYKRSYDICMQLYEKELMTETSYLHVYGLQNADFNAKQLAIVSGLCIWRDGIARAEDESTGYILPNKTVLEIAQNMPLTINSLKRLLNFKHPYVERNISAVLSIIRYSVQNYSSFEAAVQELKERRLKALTDEKSKKQAVSQTLPDNDATTSDYSRRLESLFYDPPEKEPSSSLNNKGQVQISEPPGEASGIKGNSMIGAVVEMPGSSSTKGGFVLDQKEKEEIKLEQSMNIPSHPSPDKTDQLQALDEHVPPVKEPLMKSLITRSKADEIICLDSDSDIEEPEAEANDNLSKEHGNEIICLDSDSDTEEATENKEQVVSSLAYSFKDCLKEGKPK